MMFSLFDLQVKALVQPLGSEDAWSELGDGRVELNNFTIRVTAPGPAVATTAEAAGTPVLASSSSPHVVLEDVIGDDTPFVGENNCIVWNSLDQGVSLCLMFGTDLGFRAAWSALAAMQRKPSVPLETDLFASCVAQQEPSVNESAASAAPALYSTILHSAYQPPLGYIEKHCLASSLVEYRHVTNPDLFVEKSVCETLLKLGNADLVESLVHPAVYPLFAKTIDPTCRIPSEWDVPEGLRTTVLIGEDLIVCLRTVLFLHHLRHNVLPIGIDEEIIGVIDGVHHRLLNELACGLLADDSAIKQAVEALHVVPAVAVRSSRAGTPTEVTTTMVPEKAEEHIANHLKFLSNLIGLCMSAFSKELLAPVMSKVFSHGLLEALSLVAERYTVRPAQRSPSVSRSSPENAAVPAPPAPRPPTGSSAHVSMRSTIVEEELVKLLDSCIVRLNERQEELTLNDLFRVPILDRPATFMGILSFLVRQLKDEAPDTTGVKRGVGTNTFLLYHLLGLHDDEGSSSTERNMDPEQDAKRTQFITYVVKHFIASSCKQADREDQSACTAPFIRVLEYLLRLGTSETQELIIQAVLDSSSLVLSHVDSITKQAIANHHTVAQDVLCGIVRFLREIISISFVALGEGQSSQPALLDIASNDMSGLEFPKPARLQVSVATRAMTSLFVERETITLLLRLFSVRGGERRKNLFHSTVLSTLHAIRAAPSSQLNRDIKNVLLLRDRALLPALIVRGFEEDALEDLLLRLSGPKSITFTSVDKRSGSPQYHADASITSVHSPGGKFLHVDEMACPPDARQLEDVAAFPKRLRQAIGRLSPTPRGGLPDEDTISPMREHLPPIPHLSGSPQAGSLAPPKGGLCCSPNASPPPPLEVRGANGIAPPLDQQQPVKPSQPKQAKGSSGRTTVGKHLGDGKPKVK